MATSLIAAPATAYMTSSSLVSSIQRRISIPLNQQTFSSNDLLAFANEEIQMGMLPSIMQLHEEFYVIPSTSPLVAGQSNYPIPYRAIGNKLRDLFYQDTTGNLREMTRISPDDRAFYGVRTDLNFYYKFYLQGNDVVLVPLVGPNPSGSLIMTYFIRPNQLVDEARAATITAIGPNAIHPTTLTDFTVDALPANITANSLVDILQTLPNHKTRVFDLTVVSVAANTITLTSSDLITPDFPIDVVIGDTLCTAGECIIPQIPSDLHVMLAQRVAARVMEAQGDQAGLQAANTKLSEMEIKTGVLIDNRTEGAPQKINNMRGLLRNSRLRRRGRW